MSTAGAAPSNAAPVPGYRATLEALFARRRFGIRPGLEVIGALMADAGHPERTFRSVHITGSKGKGSTAALTEAVVRAHGLRTGLFTSPHLASYRERILVDREPIPPAEVVAGVARIDAATERLRSSGAIDRAPTFFEVTTALAFDWFARSGVEAGVIEVGIGGRVDATNIVDAPVGVITTVELEHTEILGPTVAAIAREKSGILKAGMTGVLGTIPPEARAEVELRARTAGASLWSLGTEVKVTGRTLSPRGQTLDIEVPHHRVEGVHLPLFGTFQATNAALAVAAAARFLETRGDRFSERKAAKGLAGVRWAGRLERVAREPDLFYDVAHTPESARAVAASLAEIAPLADPAQCAIVFGCLRGKDVPRILESLSPLAQTLVLVPVRSDRSIPTPELRLHAVGRFPRIVSARHIEEGVRLGRAATGPDGFTLVVGSDYLVGELLRPSGSPEEPDLSDPGVGPVPTADASVVVRGAAPP
jgi:dihydrofolate synthase / folylpolyglutamate synthase